ncbi:hypothetical protein SSCG_03598 [Streptomyces clavuligerus]|nr:hypothetical protein SSCG_03598 [Streptomyces clavuligerus]
MLRAVRARKAPGVKPPTGRCPRTARPGPFLEYHEDLGVDPVHRLVLDVGRDADAQAPDVGVLVFVLPLPGSEVGVDDEVDGQVEGVGLSVWR